MNRSFRIPRPRELRSREGLSLFASGSDPKAAYLSGVRTARSKGLTERVVVYKHALRNAVIPVVTVAGLQFGTLLSGALVVETVFDWPGLGRLAFDSVLARDAPVLLALLMLSSVLVIAANLATDVVYRLIDPRIRVGGARA